MTIRRTPSPAPTFPPPQLPPNHFLSLPPSYLTQSTPFYPSGAPSSTSSHLSSGLAPNVASLASADFEVDVRTGFLPGELNVSRLSDIYVIWEEALDAAMGIPGQPGTGLQLGGRRDVDKLWRKGIEEMPTLSTDGLLSSLGNMRRTHLVLSFLLHFYVHTSPTPPGLSSSSTQQPTVIPECIAKPLLAISPLLGLPPITTYADTVLYNFHALNPSVAPALPHNPPHTALSTFTGTRSEEQFYIISALCEIAGAEALSLMRKSLDELFVADELAIRRLTVYLQKLAKQIERIGEITMQILKEVDPEEFYHLIRPWFKGGDGAGPDAPGWDFGEPMGEGRVEWAAENVLGRTKGDNKRGRMFSGPSAGQSSLIHAIDIFLTVDHSEQEEEKQKGKGKEGDGSGERQGERQGLPVIMTDHTPVSASSPASSSHPHSQSNAHSSNGHGHGHGQAHSSNGHGHGHGAPSSGPTESTFLQRMMQYMPGPHRLFLLHLSTTPLPLRQLVLSNASTHPRLAAAYDQALEALKGFREKHMRVVAVFIVQQARRKPSDRIRRLLGELPPLVDGLDEQMEVDGDVEESAESSGSETALGTQTKEVGELRGTGGTPLFKFLKRCRDNTTRAMVGKKGVSGFELV